MNTVNAVVALYCVGMPPMQIADMLSMNVDDVSEILETAERDGSIAYEPVMKAPIEKSVDEYVKDVLLTGPLLDALTSTIYFSDERLTVTPSPLGMFKTYEIPVLGRKLENDAYKREESESLVIAARRAARILETALFDGEEHVVGVNYGISVRRVIEEMRTQPDRKIGRNTVVSLFGDLSFYVPDVPIEGLDEMDVNCNILANLLAGRLGPDSEVAMLNVPGFIPHSFSHTAESLESIRDFLTGHSSFARIFGSRDESRRAACGRPLIDQMDTIVSGFGSADNYTVFQSFLRSWLSGEELASLISYSETHEVVGDLGGHFCLAAHRHPLGDELGKLIENINSRLPAAKPEHFEDVARRHYETGKGAGVLGIAVGARKAGILYALLSKRPCPISRLVIDTHCALALLNIMDRRRFNALIRDHGDTMCVSKEEWSDGTRHLIPVD